MLANIDLYGEPIPPNQAWATEKIEELEEAAQEYTVQERIEEVEKITEEYFAIFGMRMNGSLLYRLTNVILSDDLRSKHKKGIDFLSAYQLARRREGRHVRKSAYRAREVPLGLASTIATNGRNYRRPIRIYRK
ncbi:hypothetical protein [Oceanobacillus neutriphilus]|uniref:Uncharacterized protein n=1 Tax=Oceanobacillus neutriphilus TaxID=531815 RepID=A0ABQ2NY57_9BACI|nr:hypothetical protein [Oceanobacillus neutriphilus]GGP13534.1 hypothetical protein GCM10011346_33910 [Oceanobacillus neutriphilus]